jgi:hypothetical protein
MVHYSARFLNENREQLPQQSAPCLLCYRYPLVQRYRTHVESKVKFVVVQLQTLKK